MKRTRTTNPRWMVWGTALLLAAAGCGGGNGTTSGFSKTPNAQTKARLHALQSQSSQSLALGAAAGAAPNFPGGAGGATNSVPHLGAFIRNIVAAPPGLRGQVVRAMKTAGRVGARRAHDDGGVSTGGGTVEPEPQNTFYFDDFLNLWVQIKDSPTKLECLLYEDEAKSKPAGSIESTMPADWGKFPQTYVSTYTFTAGTLKGAHGKYTTTTQADFSGTSSYEDFGADGSKDRGESDWTTNGGSTWTDREDAADGTWTTHKGAFASDGGGTSREETSDGFVTETVYKTDGTGLSRFSGPAPGLPATLTWDACGKTVIRYADGSEETTPGWCGEGGSVGGGSTNSSGGSAPSPPR